MKHHGANLQRYKLATVAIKIIAQTSQVSI